MNISQKFIDRVEDLKHHTRTNILDVQKCRCPMVRNIYLNYQFEYWYDGYKYNIWEDNVHLYAVNEIPYCYDNETKNTVFMDKLETLVDQDKVWPFLLFINNKVVPWSKITIIKDYDYSYLRIDNEVDDFSTSAILVYFPLGSKEIRYGEDEDYLREANINGLYFDKDYNLLESPEFEELGVRFEFTSDIFMKILKTTDIATPVITNGVETTEMLLTFEFPDFDKGNSITTDNILIFGNDGKIIGAGNTRLNDKFGSAPYGILYASKDFTDLNCYLIFMYFNKNTNQNLSYLYTKEDLDEEKMKNAYHHYADQAYGSIVSTGSLPFDFNFSRNEIYSKNITNSMKYISRYDFSLWNKVFIDESPIKSFTYTGREFKQLADLKSYVRFSRKHSELIEDVVMMFVNSELYQHNIDISYSNNTINIPAFGILDDDVVELVMFTKCNNNVLNLVVADENTPVYIHPEYNLTDCYIMDNQISIGSYLNTPESAEGRKQYICEIESVTEVEDNHYLIHFSDVSHYGRTLKIVPKNQFRYYKYGNVEGQHKIILPQQFNYCHDIDRYIVFVNGRKIDKTEYTITIMNEYRPFDKLVLYVTTILDKSDRVDVFYVPEYLVEKYKTQEITTNGIIMLTTDYPKLYALSKHTCMVFVNGLKINPLDIKDVNMNKILVDTKYKNIHNVTIVEYINGSKEVAKYLYGLDGVSYFKGDSTWNDEVKTLEEIGGTIIGESDQVLLGVEDLDFTKYVYDQWTGLIDSLISEDPKEYEVSDVIDVLGRIYTLFRKLDESEIEEDYKNNYATLKAILYDIVIDFYVQRNGVSTGSVFDYDFEVQEWTNDPKGNLDITVFPDDDKLFDYDLTAKEADTSLVQDQKQFSSI